MSATAARAIEWMEQGLLPDAVVRSGIRRLLRERLQALEHADCAAHAACIETLVDSMNGAPIAPVPHKANEQHYEVPAEFFKHVLGPHLKYSSCWWPNQVNDLADAATVVRTT